MTIRKKTILIFSIILSLSMIIGAKTKKTSFAKSIIKEIRAYSWSRKSRGFVEIKKTRIVVELYNRSNNILKRTIYSKGKKLYEKILFKYKKGKYQGKKSYNHKNKLITASKFKKKDNEIYELVHNNNNELIWYYMYIFNSKAQLIEKRWYNNDKKIRLFYFYSYDETGNLIKRIIKNPGKIPIHVSNYEYHEFDEYNRWIIRKEIHHYGDVRNYPKEIIIRNLTKAGNLKKINKKKEPLINKYYNPPSLSTKQFLAMTKQHSKEKTPGAKVLKTALKHINAKTIIRGSCYDWINMVYNECGFKGKKRKTIFWGKEKGPYANPQDLRPGDWIMFKNLTYGDIGHSGIFLDWLDYEKRSALVIGYVGERRSKPGRFKEYDITRLFGVVRGKE